MGVGLARGEAHQFFRGGLIRALLFLVMALGMIHSSVVQAAPFLQSSPPFLESKPKAIPQFLRVKMKAGIQIYSMDEYLAGVIPAEMPLVWPLEALKAQAILAKTYALRKASLEKSDFDLHEDVRDQVFNPSLSPRKPALKGRLNQILRETHGLVLVDEIGSLYPVYFHADCGGETELPENVWGVVENGVRQKDIGCVGSSSPWKFSISKFELAHRIFKFEKSKFEAVQRARFQSLDARILQRSPTGRVLKIQLSYKNSRKESKFLIAMSGQDLREKLGFFNLRSALFEVVDRGGNFEFKGIGFGHGVGLCQNGARKLAERGATYEEILTHYFPKAKILNTLRLRVQSAKSEMLSSPLWQASEAQKTTPRQY